MNEKPVLTAIKNRLPVRPMLIGSSLYSATIIGIATFLVGLIVWPSPRIERTTDALLEMDASELESFSIAEANSELDRLCQATLTEEQIAARMVQVAKELKTRPQATPAEIMKSLSVRMLEDSTNEESTVARMTLRGSHSEFNHRLLVLLANDVALAWQQTLVEIPETDGLQVARATLLDLSKAYEEIHHESLQVADLQYSALRDVLKGAGFRDVTQSVSFPVSQSDFQNSDAESNRSERIGLIQQVSASESAENNQVNSTSSDELSLLMDQRSRVAGYCERIQMENGWSATHPEVQPLLDQLSKLDDRILKLAVDEQRAAKVGEQSNPIKQVSGTSELNEANRLENSEGYPAGLFGGGGEIESGSQTGNVALAGYAQETTRSSQPTVIQNEHFNNKPQTPAKEASTAPAPVLPFDQIRDELQQPMNQLSSKLQAKQAGFDEVLVAMGNNKIDPDEVRHGRVRLMQSPRTYVSGIDRKWKWRFIALLGVSTLAASAFSFGMGLPQNNSFSSPQEIENQLGLPIIGVIASNVNELAKRDRTRNYLRWGVRAGEIIIAAVIVLVGFSILFNSQPASDLLANPFVGLSECLRSLFQG